MPLIADTGALETLCGDLAGEAFVTVDTEFMRDRTYWPQLCLVQLAGGERHAAVDPLARGIDLRPLFDLMANPGVLKVFHAARQDIEIFHHLTGRVPAPTFDTQLAAMVLGFGEEVGYETLVTQVAKAKVDKSSRFTDWSRRPLTEGQLAYALADVTHLRVIYTRLKDQLDRSGRASWLDEEIAGLTTAETYEQPPEVAWKRIKVRSRDPRFLAIVRELAAWREREAQSRNLPRSRIVRDDILLEIAANRPRTAEEVQKVRRASLDKSSAQAVGDAVVHALQLPEADLPEVAAPVRPPRGLAPLVDLLRVLLKHCSEEHKVAQRLIANSEDLEKIATASEPEVAALRGWRREVFGGAALELKAGRIALGVQRGRIQLIRSERAEPRERAAE